MIPKVPQPPSSRAVGIVVVAPTFGHDVSKKPKLLEGARSLASLSSMAVPLLRSHHSGAQGPSVRLVSSLMLTTRGYSPEGTPADRQQ